MNVSAFSSQNARFGMALHRDLSVEDARKILDEELGEFAKAEALVPELNFDTAKDRLVSTVKVATAGITSFLGMQSITDQFDTLIRERRSGIIWHRDLPVAIVGFTETGTIHMATGTQVHQILRAVRQQEPLAVGLLMRSRNSGSH